MNYLDALEKTAQDRYKRETKVAKQQLDETLAAIAVLRKLDTVPEEKARIVAPTTETREPRRSLSGDVRVVLQESSKRFTNRNVMESLGATGDDYGVTNLSRAVRDILRRLEKSGDIFLFREGKGRRPTIYTLDENDKPRGFGLS